MKIFTDKGFKEELARRELAKEEEEYREYRRIEWYELREDVKRMRDMVERLLVMAERKEHETD